MAKVDNDERIKFKKKTVPYREAAEKILNEEQVVREMIERNEPNSAFKRLDLADAMLNLASNYLVINGVSLSIQDQKSEEALKEARKSTYKGVIYLEEVVSNAIDESFSDYEDKLEAIESVSAAQRFLLIRKMGLTIQLLEDAYGENTKWRWAFVELEGRFAAVAKNMLNLRTVMVDSDPRSPNYAPTVLHLRMARKLLMQAANRYRERYELSTNSIEDFKMGISFLSALRRLNTLTGAHLDAANVKKQLEAWTNKLTADMIKLKIQSGGKE